MPKKLYYIFFLLLVVFALDVNYSYAQKSGKKKQWKRMNRKMSNYSGMAVKFSKIRMYNGLGINISSMNYFGDIVPSPNAKSTDIKFTRPQIGVTYMRRIGTRFTLRGSFSWGRLKGDDYFSANKDDPNAKFRYVRNLSFRNDIKELAVVSMVDLLENRGNYLRRVNFTPYIFGGVAVFQHNPKAQNQNGKWVALQPLGTEGQGLDGYKKKYSKIQLSLPFGVGLRYRVNSDLDLSLEIGYRYTFTDYLDDVSGDYIADPSLLSSDARTMADRSLEPTSSSGQPRDLAVVNAITKNGYGVDYPGTKRGTPNRDVYIVTGFHITYVFVATGKFGKGKNNAKFR